MITTTTRLQFDAHSTRFPLLIKGHKVHRT